MVKMRCSQDDLFQSNRGIVHDVRPRGLVPPVVTPIVVYGVVPTPVTELSESGIDAVDHTARSGRLHARTGSPG